MRDRSWIPPDGLDRSRPRDVKLTRAGHWLLAVSLAMWFAALGALAGLLQVSSDQADERRAFLERSVEGKAEVTRLWRTRGEGNPAWVAYRLDVGGAGYTGESRLRLPYWRQLRIGDRLPVRYLPSDPRVSHLSGREREPMPAFVPFLVGGALAVGAGVLLLPLRAERRLLAEGRAARARVTRHKKVQGHGGHGTRIYFEFVTLGGRKVTGKAGPRQKPPAVGSEICVLYLPDEPRRSAPYPLSLVAPRDTRSLSPRRYRAAAASSARSTSAGLT